MERATRDVTMDALKGAAILLVVVGHAVQHSYVMFDANPLFRLIYALHMPLFMFISGYVAFYGRDNLSLAHLRKKASLLVLPFTAWYAVNYVVTGAYLRTDLASYFGDWVLSPDRGLWFLWVLFLNFAVLSVALRLETRLRVWAFPLTWLLLQFVPVNHYGIGFLKWHFTFFAAGYLIHGYSGKLIEYRRPMALVSLVAFPVLVLFWHRLTPPTFTDALSAELLSFHAHKLLPLVEQAYLYTVPMLGIIMTWAAVSVMPRLAPIFFAAFNWLGLYTLDIYVSHQYFVQYGIGRGTLHVLTGATLGLVASLAVSFLVLRRSSILAHILLGKAYPRVVTAAKNSDVGSHLVSSGQVQHQMGG